MYTLEYFLRVIGDNKYAFDYKLYQDKTLMEGGTYKYAPWKKHDSLNSARNLGRWALRTAMAKKYGIKAMHTVCLNPDSDFLSRSEVRALNIQKKNQRIEEQTPVIVLGEPQEVIRQKPNGERRYEVVEVGGVWTIKKHDTKWYTADEAKTQLFAKVVNG